MSIAVRIEAKKLTARMSKLGKKFKRRQLLEMIGREQWEWVQKNFKSQGKLIGGWRSLRPNTVAAKGHRRILFNTGELQKSFRYTIFGATVRVRSDSDIAPFHEFGTKGPYPIFPRRAQMLSFITTQGRVFRPFVMHPGLPRRKMLPTKAIAEKLAVRSMRKYIKKVTRAAR